MELTGEMLRGERVRRSLKLEEVAARTKIGLRLLQAIEANRFDLLPGGLFTRSFLRQYARALDMDETQVIASFQEQFQEPPPALPLPLPKKSIFARVPLFPAFGWLALALIAGAGFYGLWVNVHRSLPEPHKTSLELPPDPRSLRVESVPPAVNAPPPAAHPKPPQISNKPNATPAGSPSSDSPPSTVPLPGNMSTPLPNASTPPRNTTTPPPNAPPPSPNPPSPAPNPSTADPSPSIAPPTPAPPPGGVDGKTHVLFTAKEAVWVSIQCDGNPVFNGMLDANQTKTVDMSGKMVVLVGNAGGLDIAMNGKTVGPIGPTGEVRVVNLTPNGAQISRRKPESGSPDSNNPTGPGENH
jgi:cytoskeleton protein RodZ